MASIALPLHFGVELELVHTISKEDAAELLRGHGIECTVAEWSKKRPYNTWLITDDESIKPAGFEVVSPVLLGEGGLARTMDVATVLLQSGAQVNETTGFHVHLDASGMSSGDSMSLKELKSIAATSITSEMVFDSLMPDHRRANKNKYCQSNVFQQPHTSCVPIINDCTTIQELVNVVCVPVPAAVDQDDPDEDEEHSRRYHKLNYTNLLPGSDATTMTIRTSWRPRIGYAYTVEANGTVKVEKKTVEFRLHNGTCNPVDIVNWVKLLQVFVNCAKQRKPKRPQQNPLDTFEKLFGWLRKHNPGRPMEELESFYQDRQRLFEMQKSATFTEWPKYLAWIECFEQVPFLERTGAWQPCAKVLEVSSSKEWTHAPVKVRVPGKEWTHAWVGLKHFDLAQLHGLHSNVPGKVKSADLSCLQPGVCVEALGYDDVWCTAQVLEVSTSNSHRDAPVKIRRTGLLQGTVEWIGIQGLRSKSLARAKRTLLQEALSELSPGMQVQCQADDGLWYAADVLAVANAVKISGLAAAAPVKVHFHGKLKAGEKWVALDCIRSRFLKPYKIIK